MSEPLVLHTGEYVGPDPEVRPRAYHDLSPEAKDLHTRLRNMSNERLESLGFGDEGDAQAAATRVVDYVEVAEELAGFATQQMNESGQGYDGMLAVAGAAMAVVIACNISDAMSELVADAEEKVEEAQKALDEAEEYLKIVQESIERGRDEAGRGLRIVGLITRAATADVF